MSQYTLKFNWKQKEADAAVIDGDEYQGEFETIQVALNSKVENVPSPTSGNLVKTDGSGAVLDSGLQTNQTPQLDNTATWTAAQDFANDSSMAGNKLTNFPAGTLMLFQQTSAPVGWTKQTAHNNKALRVVTGAASSGGSSTFSTVFGKTGTDNESAHTHPIPHNHGPGSLSGSVVGGSGSGGLTSGNHKVNMLSGVTGGTNTSNSSAGSAHKHTMDIRVQYVDLIIAKKDA